MSDKRKSINHTRRASEKAGYFIRNNKRNFAKIAGKGVLVRAGGKRFGKWTIKIMKNNSGEKSNG